MNYKLLIIYLILFAVADLSLTAQNPVVVRDFETWSAIELKVGLGNRWDVEIEEQIRLWKNSSITDEVFTGLNLKYSIVPKYLKLAVGYRYIFDNRIDEGYDQEQRLNFDIIGRYGFDNLKLSSRLRYQNRNDVGEKASSGDYPTHTWRIMLEGEYKIKNWKADPVFSVELFRSSQKYTLPQFDNIRFRLGTSYGLNKFGKISVFYQLDKELGASYPKITNVFGLTYSYDFGNVFSK